MSMECVLKTLQLLTGAYHLPNLALILFHYFLSVLKCVTWIQQTIRGHSPVKNFVTCLTNIRYNERNFQTQQMT